MIEEIRLGNLSDRDISYLGDRIEQLKWSLLWKPGEFQNPRSGITPEQINELQAMLNKKKVSFALVVKANDVYIDKRDS